MKSTDEQNQPGHAGERRTGRGRQVVFLLIVLASVAGAAGYAAFAAWRAQAAAARSPGPAVQPVAALPADRPGSAASATTAVAAASAAQVPPQVRAGTTVPPAPAGPEPAHPFVLFRSTALDDQYGRVNMEVLDPTPGPRLGTPLQCDRVHFAAGRGICLEAKRGALTTYHAHVFDREFRVLHSVALAGPPSRARVSPDGKLAAMTVFVSGHSYGGVDFTTRTSVLDTASGAWVAEDLEKFDVALEGATTRSNDFNFWGITFARDSRHFYATLGTAGKTFLVEGDLASSRMRIVRADVECPSLSPDNRRIAFKRRLPGAGPPAWQLRVLDLASGNETALAAETRSVDDQVEWLDDHHVLYGLPSEAPQSAASTNVWALSARGSGAPRLLLPMAASPAVVR